MPVKSVAILKTFFETGDRPTESQFADLIDSFVHKTTGSVTISNNYDPVTGDVSISFSDGSTIAFNVKGNENEPISFISGLQDALDGKVDKVAGKELSTNDFTNALKTKLDGLENYAPPTSEAISFIDGLQDALDAKANEVDAVRSVNGVTPDATGNVNLSQSGGVSQSISSLAPTIIDTGGGATYSYNEQISTFLYVKTGAIINFNFTLYEINTTGVPTGGLILSNLAFPVEARSGGLVFLLQGSSLSADEVGKASGIISPDPSNNISIANGTSVYQDVVFSNGSLEISGFYVEKQSASSTQGVGFDAIGVDAIGQN